MNLHECTGIIVVIATNTDIMFSTRTLRSVEEAIIINVKRYERSQSSDKTDRCHRPVVLHDNPFLWLRAALSFPRMPAAHTEFFSPDRTFYASEKIRAWFFFVPHVYSTPHKFRRRSLSISLTAKLTLDLYFTHTHTILRKISASTLPRKRFRSAIEVSIYPWEIRIA